MHPVCSDLCSFLYDRYKVDSATLMNDSDFDDDEFYGSDSDSGKWHSSFSRPVIADQPPLLCADI